MTSSNTKVLSCFRCGGPVSYSERILRRDTCQKCDADLHCCMNCRHFSPSAHNQCNEPQAEWVRDKERANFCDYFDPKAGGAGKAASDASARARSRFEDLFRKQD